MFKHEYTGETYYSVREKINYYKKVIAGKIDAPVITKRKAKGRLRTLERLNAETYNEPTMIVTNDKHFGNRAAKPRACVVVGKDDKGRLIVCPVYDRNVKAVILDKDISRQVDGREHKIADSEVYEIKNITGLKPLSKNDKRKIRDIHTKK